LDNEISIKELKTTNQLKKYEVHEKRKNGELQKLLKKKGVHGE
jgi:hypothetical protein